MRRTHLAATLIFWAGYLVSPAGGFEIEDRVFYPASEQPKSVLRIISTADREVFEPIVRHFQAEEPQFDIDYTIASSSELMKAIYNEGASFDLAISSAMDLQTKLANDGFAKAYRSLATDGLPDWAKWRGQLFAFTQEPVVVVVSDRHFNSDEAPTSREELIALLRDNPGRFQNRIGTYDVRNSGFGYLMATQDSRNSESFWRLTEVMGRLNARLYCCSGEMINDVASGKLALAYNVLGSYAESQLAADSRYRIIALNDFVNVMLRTALIPSTATNEPAAQSMIDYLVTLNERPEIVAASGLPAIDDQELKANNALRPIRFGPGLLVFLDSLKRENFLRSWESSVEQ